MPEAAVVPCPALREKGGSQLRQNRTSCCCRIGRDVPRMATGCALQVMASSAYCRWWTPREPERAWRARCAECEVSVEVYCDGLVEASQPCWHGDQQQWSRESSAPVPGADLASHPSFQD